MSNATDFADPSGHATLAGTRLALAAVLVDTTPPPVPSLNVSKNAAGYVNSDTPFVVGIAEANATVRVYNGSTLVGSASADAQGFWSLTTSVQADGNISLYATATDAAGNVSPNSATLAFSIDSHAPLAPTGGVTASGAGNQPAFAGSAEAGSTLTLLDGVHVLGQTTVGANGLWSITPNPLADGAYNVVLRSTDIAGNYTDAPATLAVTIASALNIVGTAANDTLKGSAGNNHIDGLAGIDTVVYTGALANYAIDQATEGFTVRALSGTDGTDALVNVERLVFADAHVALDIDGSAGQAYRLYRAAFDRVPDTAGVGYWIGRMDAGASEHQVATEFISSDEFKTLYGSNPSTTDFVTKLYANVLHRALDQAGFDFWVSSIDQHGAQRADVLAQFSESTENQAQVIGVIGHGFTYIPYTA